MPDAPRFPLWNPPPVVAAILRWLRARSHRRPRALGAAALSTSVGVLLFAALRKQSRALHTTVPLSRLLKQITMGQVEAAVVSAGVCSYRLRSVGSSQTFHTQLLAADTRFLVKLLHRHAVEFRVQGPAGWRAMLVLLLPFAYLGVCGWLLWRMQSDLNPSSDHGDPASVADEPGGGPISFTDVGGMPHVKSQVMEVVDFFHQPERYERLGARRPRGILLAGPPGTGKTLLARAVAGTVGLPFLSCSGSDFVEVFVGRGSRRVRNLFEEASRRAPCVLFIDELDALGARRSTSGGGSEEHEHTLNQLLAQMDGIGSSSRILIIGATNRLAALDPALVRPGRFDRVLQLSLPDQRGRADILQLHTKHHALPDQQAIVQEVARRTEGMSGAELANLANEAAIRAVRHGRPGVCREDFEEALLDYCGSRQPADPPQPAAGGASGAQLFAAMAAAFGAVNGRSSGSIVEEPE